MTMTRQHFVLIAETIRTMPPGDWLPSGVPIWRRQDVEEAFASALSSTNPNFNRARFLRACGVED